MTKLTLNKKEIEMRIGYKQLKTLESYYKGLSFEEILSVALANPTLTDIEKVVYVSLQNPEFTLLEFGDVLDEAFNSEEITFDGLIDALFEAVDTSVFLKTMAEKKEKEKKAATKKTELKKAGAV